LVDQCQKTTSRALWIAPTELSGSAIARRLTTPPDIVTFPELARRIVWANDSDWQFAAEVHQRLLLEQVIADLAKARRLQYYARAAEGPGFADAIFDVLTEFKGRGITPAQFETALGRVKSRPKDRDVATIFVAFDERLNRHRLLDRATTYARAAQLVRAGRMGRYRNARTILVDGFVDFTPPQLDLLTGFLEQVDQLWISLPSDLAASVEREQLFRRSTSTIDSLRQAANKVTLVQLDAGSEYRPPERRAGLAHLEANLFGNQPPPSPNAEGIDLIEAPGAPGEIRMCARSIKRRLLDGTPPENIVVTARSLRGYCDLIREVFAEYGIPFELDETTALAGLPAVAALLRAYRLAIDDYPFAPTTALLRNTLLHPDWPEVAVDPDIALKAEVVLRSLGVSQGQTAYLNSLAAWAAAPEPPLEDDEAETPRRVRLHRLAIRCRPFLAHFFEAWESIPTQATVADHLTALRVFAGNLGLDRDSADAAALEEFYAEIDSCCAFGTRIYAEPSPMTAAEFADLASRLALSGRTSEPVDEPCVRIISAETARALDCAELIILALGEASFPQFSGGGPIYSDGERQELHDAGLDLRTAGERLPDEQLLFLQLVAKPKNRLTLSHTAVDASGNPLLPSSFLDAVRDLFGAGAITCQRREMLIGGFDTDPPLCPAEYRIRWSLAKSEDRPKRDGDLFEHLRQAEQVERTRFRTKEFSSFDGLLASPIVRGEIDRKYGPHAIFSATALENYAACPFKFFVGQVLGLAPLDEPQETVAVAMRGRVVHRALARLHRRRHRQNAHQPDGRLIQELIVDIEAAVDEQAQRVGSPALRALWKLEARWLHRLADRYAAHWEKFLENCKKLGVVPQPHSFELDFGLPSDTGEPLAALSVRHDGEEVRVAGRIDRVDVAALANGSAVFWIIDYKTGGSIGYSSSDVAELRRLQLALYAMVFEQLVPEARPLGLAYWFLRDGSGVKLVMPGRGSSWIEDNAAWPAMRERVAEHVVATARAIRRGEFPLHPQSENCTATCEFGQMCRIAQSRGIDKHWSLGISSSAE
jgi:ATP-dependent helicase/DNAse subunit B